MLCYIQGKRFPWVFPTGLECTFSPKCILYCYKLIRTAVYSI